MNEVEHNIKARAWAEKDKLEGENRLTAGEVAHLEFLRGVDSAYRLTQRQRSKLYAIGKKIGINGRQDYANSIINAKAKGRKSA